MEEWSDEIVEISNNGELDPQDRRVRIDTKKWLMSKLAPRRYGDKLTVSGDPAATLLHVHQLDEMISSFSAPGSSCRDGPADASASVVSSCSTGEGPTAKRRCLIVLTDPSQLTQ
jgi:hypothetical protein